MLPRADTEASEAPRPVVAPRPRPEAQRPLAAALVLLLGCALLGRADARAFALAGAGALLALALPPVARFPAALLVGWGIQRGGWPLVAATVALLGAAGCWPRPATLLRRALVVLATGLTVFVATRVPLLAFGGAASALVLLTPIEDAAPRSAIAVALLLAALPGAWGGYRAWTARAAARRTGDDLAWQRAEEACRSFGWGGCTEDALVARAQLARKRGDEAAALALLQTVPQPARAETELLRADVELAQHLRGPAQARLWRVASARPDARAVLAPQTAVDYAHALARAGRRDAAFEVLTGVPGAEAERFRALLRPRDQALVAALGNDVAPANVCLRAQLAGDADAARACLDKVPDHAPSRALLALPPNAPPPTPGDESFAGTLRLTPSAQPTHCVKRGEVPPLTFTWEVEDGFSSDEGMYVFVHANGPRVLGFDHLPGGRQVSSLLPGERFADPLTTPVPLDAPAGLYTLDVGLYSPESSVRLQPRGLPTHISFFRTGSFEVCP